MATSLFEYRKMIQMCVKVDVSSYLCPQSDLNSGELAKSQVVLKMVGLTWRSYGLEFERPNVRLLPNVTGTPGKDLVQNDQPQAVPAHNS